MIRKKPLVYTCFCTDNIHEGHLHILDEARKLGDVIVGVLADAEMIRYNRFPIKTTHERLAMIKALPDLEDVVVQDTIMYDKMIKKLEASLLCVGRKAIR